MNMRFECVEEALRMAIKTSEKSQKDVACAVWPTLTADQATQRLRDYLKTSKRTKLGFDELIFISNYIGIYWAVEHIALSCGFDLKPLRKETALADLKNELDQLVTKAGCIAKSLAALQDN